MVFVCQEKQFPGVSRGSNHGEENNKRIKHDKGAHQQQSTLSSMSQ